MARAAKNAPVPESAKTDMTAVPQTSNASPVRSANPVPGIVVAAVCIIFAVAGALILPKKLNE